MEGKPLKRWVSLLPLILGLTLPAAGQRSHLSKRVTLVCSSVRLDQVLDNLGREAGFSFSYNAGLVPADSLISADFLDEKVGDILTGLLGERMGFKEVGNHVILMKPSFRETRQTPAPRSEWQISGFVEDGRTGHRLQDATLYEVSSRKSVLTDVHGHYAFAMPAGKEIHGLYVAKKGYADTVVFLHPTRDVTLNIPLQPLTGDILRIAALPAELRGNYIDSMALVAMLVPRKTLVTSENLQVFGPRAFQGSLIPYVGTNWMNKGSYTSAVSFNLLAGYAGGVNGIELGGLVNIVRRDVRGLQIGGLANIVGGHNIGLQIGGLFNLNQGRSKGVQISGLVNYQRDTLTGVQIGGLCNFLQSKMQGVQVGGLMNVTTDHADGWQVAGLLNVAVKDVSQTQIGGLVNYGRHVYGLQLGGLVNVANGNVNGLQIGGLCNYARSVTGLQLGAFNFSREIESGVPMGFFSYVHKGGLHRFELYADEIFYANVAFRSGVSRFYNIFQVGVGTSWMVNYMYGIGTSFAFGQRVAMDVSLISGLVFSTSPGLALHGTLTKLLPAVEYRFGKHFSIFAGPSLNLYAFDDSRSIRPDGIAPYTFFDQVKGYQRLQMWIGGTVGIRL